MLNRTQRWTACALLAFCTAACEGSKKEDDGTNGTNGTNTETPGESLTTGSNTAGAGSGNSGEGCQADVEPAQLQPVYMAFAFDQSGSMGRGDMPCHVQSLKWDPIVAATKAFFTKTTSKGLSASLVLFPFPGGDSVKCDVDSYVTPLVHMQSLPSPAFATALDAIETTEAAWKERGGTPTEQALEGTIAYLRSLASKNTAEDAKYVAVLVTDGMPSDCSNSAAGVEALLEGVADEFQTFVIGVENPVGEVAGCNVRNLDNLGAFAVAGGTGDATIIETGNPAATQAAFEAAVDAIREQTASCDVPIPAAPGGSAFDPTLVNVTLTTGGVATPLGYDDGCKATNGWRFDDPKAPKVIVLCADTCDAAKDPAVDLTVEFGCQRRPGGFD